MTLKQNQIVIIFIGGFLVPKNWKCYYDNLFPSLYLKIISVYPSPIGSINDRIYEIFYELKGGIIKYNKEHSKYHNHNNENNENSESHKNNKNNENKNEVYKEGKYQNWNENNPVYLVGHSYGGITARALHTYLVEKRFNGYDTNEKWVSGIITVNSPLNGALMTYLLGAHSYLPPIVKWGSVGYFLSNFIHLTAFLDIDEIFGFKFNHWNLSYKHSNSIIKLINSILGVTVGSNTDNAAYDMTIHSQLQWAKYLPTYPNTFYLSMTGRINFNTTIQSNKQLQQNQNQDQEQDQQGQQSQEQQEEKHSIIKKILRIIQSIFIDIFFYLIGVHDKKICNIDCSEWFHHGWDGLVSCFSQTKPSLPSPYNHSCYIINKHSELVSIKPGHWYSWELPNDHLRLAVRCTYSWDFIWNAVQIMERQKQLLQQSKENKYLQESEFQSFKLDSLPDMQSVPVETFDRYTISYPITFKEGLLAIFITFIGIYFMLSKFILLDHTKQIYTTTTSATSAITCCIGFWLLHLQFNQKNEQIKSQQNDENQRKEVQLFSSQLIYLPKSIFSPLLPSEGILIIFHIFQIILLFSLFQTFNLQVYHFMNLLRLFQIYSLILFCDRTHENISIFQLSFHFLLLCYDANSFSTFPYLPSSLLSTSITSVTATTTTTSLLLPSYLFTSIYLKEILHILSKFGFIINHFQSNSSSSSNSSFSSFISNIIMTSTNILWVILWIVYLCVLSCFIYFFTFSISSYKSIIFFVFMFEIVGAMKELSLAYQLYYLKEYEMEKKQKKMSNINN